MTDTDNLLLKIKSKNIYRLADDVHSMFDTSNNPKDHPPETEVGVNKKVPGMWKDKSAGKQIAEYAGARPIVMIS